MYAHHGYRQVRALSSFSLGLLVPSRIAGGAHMSRRVQHCFIGLVRCTSSSFEEVFVSNTLDIIVVSKIISFPSSLVYVRERRARIIRRK